MEITYPEFPISCCACEAKHNGDIEKAIDDGWNIAVIKTKSDRLVQFAGCPLHFTEVQTKAMDYLKSKQRHN